MTDTQTQTRKPLTPDAIKSIIDKAVASVAPAGPGHNQPPAFDHEKYADTFREALEYADAAGEWLDLKEIQTEEQASYLVDFVAGARALKKKVETARKDEKQPHIEAGKAVDAAFAKPGDMLERTIKTALGLLTPWQDKIAKKQAEEAARLEKEAAEKAAEAAKKLAEAESRNDIAGQVDAEAAAKEAEKAQKDAARAAKAKTGTRSASGGGRTVSNVKVRTAAIRGKTPEEQAKSIRALFMHYQADPAVRDCLLSLAQRDVRAKDVDDSAIPGIDIIETTQAR